MENTKYSMTQVGRLWMPCLITARAMKNKQGQEQGKPRFETSILLPSGHPDLGPISKIVQGLIAEKWKPNPDRPELTAKNANLPYKSGNKMADKRAAKLAAMSPPQKPDREYLRGHVVLQARTGEQYEPLISFLPPNGLAIDYHGPARAANASKFYSGAEALLEVKFVWYDYTPLVPAGGVSARLNVVMVTGDGERFPDAGKSAASSFKGYIGRPSMVDPTAGEDDDELEF